MQPQIWERREVREKNWRRKSKCTHRTKMKATAFWSEQKPKETNSKVHKENDLMGAHRIPEWQHKVADIIFYNIPRNCWDWKSHEKHIHSPKQIDACTHNKPSTTNRFISLQPQIEPLACRTRTFMHWRGQMHQSHMMRHILTFCGPFYLGRLV